MAVYVDDMYKLSIGQFRRMKMSHLIADTHQELLEMVDKIGLNRKWIQKEGTAGEHFDVAMVTRKKAVAAGAIEILSQELGEKVLKRYEDGNEHLARYSGSTRGETREEGTNQVS